MKEKIAKFSFLDGLVPGRRQIISFMVTLFVTRLLAPEDYGLIALASIWTFTVSMLAEMGLGAAIIQFRDLDERELNTCFWLMVSVAILGYILLFLSSPNIAEWFNSPKLASVLRVMGLTLPIIAIRVVPDSILRKRLLLDKISQAEIASVLITMPLVFVLALAGVGVWALVAGAIAMPLVQTVMTFGS